MSGVLHPLRVCDLGRRRYGPVLELQRALVRGRLEGSVTDDLLLLVEHEPVVTLGRGTRSEGTSLLLPFPELERRGYDVAEVERGGDVTVHAPGQLVGYPILDLQGHRPDVHWYLRSLEEALVRALQDVGVRAERNPGLTGVWVGPRKIASIGVHVKRWVTLHGFALNVTTDLTRFDVVIPCGIQGVVMTSVARELPASAESATLWDRTREAVILRFGEVFERSPVLVPSALLQGAERAEKAEKAE
jgi:lipoate-protein ligase B